MSNPKVIDIETKEALEVLPFTKDVGESLIAHLMQWQGFEAGESFGEQWTLGQVMQFIENNSGADRHEIMTKIGSMLEGA